MPDDPVVWLLHGHKAGDNSQVLALAEALSWPYEIKRLAYRSWELLTNRLLQVTLAGTDPRHSSPLEPPWPDLVITAGSRAGAPGWCMSVAHGRRSTASTSLW